MSTTTLDVETYPLFPLHAVLIPGAAMGLRLFETRYLDLVRECGRRGTGFGICMILDGEESGTPATPATVGTEARIEDFGSGRDGLLTLRVRGGRRFRVHGTQVRGDGLVVGDIEWFEPDPDDELQPQHALLATVLHRLLDRFGGEHVQAPPSRFDDAAWVGWRLAELMPLGNQQRLALLREPDAHARLDALLAMLS